MKDFNEWREGKLNEDRSPHEILQAYEKQIRDQLSRWPKYLDWALKDEDLTEEKVEVFLEINKALGQAAFKLMT